MEDPRMDANTSDDTLADAAIANGFEPDYKDLPDDLADQITLVFRNAAMDSARKIVSIAAGTHQLSHAPTVLGHEKDAAKYIIEFVTGGAKKAEMPWNDWMKELLRGEGSTPNG